jgi:hypothetical protein
MGNSSSKNKVIVKPPIPPFTVETLYDYLQRKWDYYFFLDLTSQQQTDLFVYCIKRNNVLLIRQMLILRHSYGISVSKVPFDQVTLSTSEDIIELLFEYPVFSIQIPSVRESLLRCLISLAKQNNGITEQKLVMRLFSHFKKDRRCLTMQELFSVVDVLVDKPYFDQLQQEIPLLITYYSDYWKCFGTRKPDMKSQQKPTDENKHVHYVSQEHFRKFDLNDFPQNTIQTVCDYFPSVESLWTHNKSFRAAVLVNLKDFVKYCLEKNKTKILDFLFQQEEVLSGMPFVMPSLGLYFIATGQQRYLTLIKQRQSAREEVNEQGYVFSSSSSSHQFQQNSSSSTSSSSVPSCYLDSEEGSVT